MELIVVTTICVQSSLVQVTKIVQMDFILSHRTGTKLRSFCPLFLDRARGNYDNCVF